MGQQAAEDVDFAATLGRELDQAFAGLNRAAVDLGASTAAALLPQGPQVEIAYFWSHTGGTAPSQRILDPQQQFSEAVRRQAGSLAAGNALAQLLRDSLSPHSQSFLLHHRGVRRREVTFVFGFAAAEPPYPRLPVPVAESLDLIGLATWSVKEIAALNAELKNVRSRLAGRKLVERAKGILQSERGFSEQQAYEHLRDVSRRRRITLTALAAEVLRTHAHNDPTGSPAVADALQAELLGVSATLKRTS